MVQNDVQEEILAKPQGTNHYYHNSIFVFRPFSSTMGLAYSYSVLNREALSYLSRRNLQSSENPESLDETI